MKGSSKVVMGATMAIVIILAVVLCLVLVLLAELYCSLLFRRQQKLNKGKKPDSARGSPPISEPQQGQEQSNPSPLSSFYAQGVLEAPRRFLFPKLPSKREQKENADNHDVEKQTVTHAKLHQFLKVQSPHQIGLASSFTSPSPSYISFSKPHQPNLEHEHKTEAEEGSDGNKRENLVYISNPIYDNDVARASRLDTPFETPDSSPSRLDDDGSESSGDEEIENVGASSPCSLPLTPMKDLPAKAGSVALRNVRSLGPSVSDSTSHIGRSSSSSASPCTSPSW